MRRPAREGRRLAYVWFESRVSGDRVVWIDRARPALLHLSPLTRLAKSVAIRSPDPYGSGYASQRRTLTGPEHSRRASTRGTIECIQLASPYQLFPKLYFTENCSRRSSDVKPSV